MLPGVAPWEGPQQKTAVTGEVGTCECGESGVFPLPWHFPSYIGGMKQHLLLLSAACLMYTASHAEPKGLLTDKEVVVETDVGPSEVLTLNAIPSLEVTLLVQEEATPFVIRGACLVPELLDGFLIQDTEPPSQGWRQDCMLNSPYMALPGYLGAGSGGFGDL